MDERVGEALSSATSAAAELTGIERATAKQPVHQRIMTPTHHDNAS
jgi:hypothetical protein